MGSHRRPSAVQGDGQGELATSSASLCAAFGRARRESSDAPPPGRSPRRTLLGGHHDGRDGERAGRPGRFRARRSEDAAACGISHTCIQQAPLFAGRNPTFLRRLTEYLQLEMHAHGDFIMKEGEEGDKMYFLHRGTVEVLVGPELKRVATLSSGSIFGEMALFGSPKRTASIRTLEFCDCRVINHRVFHLMLQRFPDEQKFFQEMACERRQKLHETDKDKEKEKEKEDGIRGLLRQAVPPGAQGERGTERRRTNLVSRRMTVGVLQGSKAKESSAASLASVKEGPSTENTPSARGSGVQVAKTFSPEGQVAKPFSTASASSTAAAGSAVAAGPAQTGAEAPAAGLSAIAPLLAPAVPAAPAKPSYKRANSARVLHKQASMGPGQATSFVGQENAVSKASQLPSINFSSMMHEDGAEDAVSESLRSDFDAHLNARPCAEPSRAGGTSRVGARRPRSRPGQRRPPAAPTFAPPRGPEASSLLERMKRGNSFLRNGLEQLLSRPAAVTV